MQRHRDGSVGTGHGQGTQLCLNAVGPLHRHPAFALQALAVGQAGLLHHDSGGRLLGIGRAGPGGQQQGQRPHCPQQAGGFVLVHGVSSSRPLPGAMV